MAVANTPVEGKGRGKNVIRVSAATNAYAVAEAASRATATTVRRASRKTESRET